MVDLVIAVLLFCMPCLFAVYVMYRHDKERNEWREERRELMNRVQSGSLVEFKAAERLETPAKRREKDPELKRLEGAPWA